MVASSLAIAGYRGYVILGRPPLGLAGGRVSRVPRTCSVNGTTSLTVRNRKDSGGGYHHRLPHSDPTGAFAVWCVSIFHVQLGDVVVKINACSQCRLRLKLVPLSGCY